MSLRNIIFVFFFSLLLVLIQSAFLFQSFALILFLFVILYNILEKPRSLDGFFAGFFAGFWLDIYTQLPIGTFITTMLLLVYITKYVLKKYVGIPSFS